MRRLVSAVVLVVLVVMAVVGESLLRQTGVILPPGPNDAEPAVVAAPEPPAAEPAPAPHAAGPAAAPAASRTVTTDVTEEIYTLRPIDGVIADRYDALAAIARAGDAGVAMDLHDNLADCLQLFGPEPADVAINVQIMLETPDLVGADVLAAKLGAPGAEQRRETFDRLTSRAGSCKGLTVAQLEARLEWFDLAARLGNVHAQRAYLTAMTPDHATALRDPAAVQRWKDTGYAYLDRLANAGDRHAMHELAFELWDGSVLPRDRARAYAIFVVAYERWPGAGGEHRTQRLDRRRAQLTADEVARAERLASELRARCCR